MVLEGLIIFLHTTRLVWVEWFSKFYKDEGRPFKSLELEALPKEGVVPSVTM
jgi:vacuolar-type H+-ATPase subunit I/STV1